MTTSATTKLSMTIFTSVYQALETEAEQTGRELHEHIQRILGEHVIRNQTIAAEEARRIELMWSLVDRAAEVARDLCRNGEFDRDITLKAIKRCMEDRQWVDDYAAFVKDDIYKHGNPLKGPLNREIGFRIRAGIGGTVVTGPDGKKATQKVLGEIIQSYTLMESYDPEAVEA